MPFFKYTVANKEGKKLSGIVEADEITTARNELNNLGFSVISLEKSLEGPKTEQGLNKFIFEAIDKSGKLITGTIPSRDKDDALKKLKNEYGLTVTAVWRNGDAPEVVAQAREEGKIRLTTELKLPETSPEIQAVKTSQDLEQERFVRTKIEYVLKKIQELLLAFEKDIDIDQRVDINRKIDKLLRIKNSTNLNYILLTAEEVLKTIAAQQKSLSAKGMKEKEIALSMRTKHLLETLHMTNKPKSFSEDILQRISKWENRTGNDSGIIAKIFRNPLGKLKKIFETPEEILTIKNQISSYNRQLWEFILLYFKEPTPEYKVKVKNAIKAIWESRKQAIENLKTVKRSLKERIRQTASTSTSSSPFLEEINAFTGWLLAFYVIYYFVGLYLNNKDFGLSYIPKGFSIYESYIFKYILTILFLLHCTIALKVNFFKQNKAAGFVLVPVFFLLTVITLLNF